MEEDTYGSSAESYLSAANPSSPDASDASAATTPPPAVSSHQDHEIKLKEAQAFFADLKNYLGIGCLIFREILAEDEQQQTTPDWQEVNQLPPLSTFDGLIYSHVQSLVAAGWIKLLWSPSVDDCQFQIYRVYVLPFDAGHRFVDRRSRYLTQALEGLLTSLDVSSHAWRGHYRLETATDSDKFDPWATKEDGSLFWLFNKIPSPNPRPEMVQERYSREALEDLLDPNGTIPGMKTSMYSYQRRSAGLMLQRESVTKLAVDPRLEERIAPDGTAYYYSARDCTILRHPRYYEACKGGICSESMGAGKTLICLALILATKKHYPKIPPRWNQPRSRPSVGSLTSMAISSINRKSVPWEVEFERIATATGEHMSGCRRRLEAEPASYEITKEPQRWNRATIIPPPEKLLLAATTLVVVPHNLLRQWQNEIKKHIEQDALNVLIMEDPKKPLPMPNELRKYDVVLFTRRRFEQEARDGSDGQGRRMATTQRLCRCPYIGGTRTRNCTCLRTDDLYDSPLKHLHFLRFIIDEGHFFSNSSGMAASVTEKLLKVDHRWVVSGTPAKDLLGVEVDMSSAENLWQNPASAGSREAVLQQRRHFSEHDKTGAIKSLGSLASAFLKIRPWAGSDESGEPKAEWDEYIFRHEGFKSRKVRTFSGFSTGLRRTLESMVIKTQPSDVEKDIEMPPLTHEIVRLEPSFYDKLTANLFTLVLTANAVTSERTDQDYLFHKNSAKARYQLVANLRQSAFFWTAFSVEDVQASIKRSETYLEKNDTECSPEDRELLTNCLKTAKTVLESGGWKSMSRSHELGMFVERWPRESWDYWAFDDERQPLLTGISHLLEAQRHVHGQVTEDEPGAGLAGAGITALSNTRPQVKKEPKTEETKNGGGRKVEKKDVLNKSGIPTSSLNGEPALKRRTSSSGSSPVKKSPEAFKVTKSVPSDRTQGTSRKTSQLAQRIASLDESNVSSGSADADASTISPTSPFLASRIVGTTSAKLSYLSSEILKYYQHEKILVFYDGDNAAFYIAQMLDLLHIKHEIYAKSLKAAQKSEYAVRFDQETEDRVLLMDVRQAAFGLNLPAASRIYFVNPVCRENIEAQAIKRAHRIGQKKAVHVETLVLKGTIEEKMLDRSKRMSRAEHLNASHLEDDGGIKQIIQSATPLPIDEGSLKLGRPQMARLEVPQQVWCRKGWREYYRTSSRSTAKKRKASTIAGATAAEGPGDLRQDKKKKVVRRSLAFVDCRSNAPDPATASSARTPLAIDSDDCLERIQLGEASSSAASIMSSLPQVLTKGVQQPPGISSLLPARTIGLTGVPLHEQHFSTSRATTGLAGVPSHETPIDPQYRGMSIATLLDDEAASPEQRRSTEDDDLVQQILSRL